MKLIKVDGRLIAFFLEKQTVCHEVQSYHQLLCSMFMYYVYLYVSVHCALLILLPTMNYMTKIRAKYQLSMCCRYFKLNFSTSTKKVLFIYLLYIGSINQLSHSQAYILFKKKETKRSLYSEWKCISRNVHVQSLRHHLFKIFIRSKILDLL